MSLASSPASHKKKKKTLASSPSSPHKSPASSPASKKKKAAASPSPASKPSPKHDKKPLNVTSFETTPSVKGAPQDRPEPEGTPPSAKETPPSTPTADPPSSPTVDPTPSRDEGIISMSINESWHLSLLGILPQITKDGLREGIKIAIQSEIANPSHLPSPRQRADHPVLRFDSGRMKRSTSDFLKNKYQTILFSKIPDTDVLFSSPHDAHERFGDVLIDNRESGPDTEVAEEADHFHLNQDLEKLRVRLAAARNALRHSRMEIATLNQEILSPKFTTEEIETCLQQLAVATHQTEIPEEVTRLIAELQQTVLPKKRGAPRKTPAKPKARPATPSTEKKRKRTPSKPLPPPSSFPITSPGSRSRRKRSDVSDHMTPEQMELGKTVTRVIDARVTETKKHREMILSELVIFLDTSQYRLDKFLEGDELHTVTKRGHNETEEGLRSWLKELKGGRRSEKVVYTSI